jgi:type I restriction enzyme S subunit
MAYVNLAPEEFDDLQLRPGDVIFNRTNSEELVGKTAVWRSGQPAVLASYLVRLRLKPAYDSEFFAALLNTGHYKRLFRLRCRKAVNQANISPTLLVEFPMYDPPELLQREYGRIVREQLLDRAIHREALRQTEHLFQSLLNQYFGDA